MTMAAETGLRQRLRSGPGLAFLTGGQTGVDTAAARAALAAGLDVHLVFPRGLRQEDGPLTADRRQQLAGAVVHELASADFEVRTRTCVAVADAVVLLDPAGGAGCQETARAAAAFDRPLLTPAPGELTTAQAADWLGAHGPAVLMIAGCRASLLAGAPQPETSARLRADVAAIVAAAARLDDRMRDRATFPL
jgi:putative molybdenum carrier protein